VRIFRIALTGDFLDESGGVAYGDAGLGLFEGRPEVRWRFVTDLAPRPGDASYWSRLYSLEVAPEHIRDVDGLVVLRPWVKRSAFAERAGDLVVIGRSGAGYDKIDLAACTEHGVAVFNAPMALNHSTASSALLFMLALAKRLPEQERIVRHGRWDLQPSVMGGELQGRTLGIVGLGHSGRELVRLVAPFDMRIIAYSPHADPAVARELGVELTSLEDVLRRSDFVSLHCRLNDATRGLIGAAQLELLKPSAYFINVGRGELVDQAALAAALRERRVAAASLDVFQVEPLPLDDPLLDLDNVILTPHWSASTADVWRATGRAMAEGMLRAARGLVPENVVNPEVLDRPAFREKLARFAENANHPDRDLDESNEVE
jgi:phosphoglycerate dehydrogenase-like enzyme